LAATGRYEGAERDARRYLEARPDHAEMHFVLGVVLHSQQRSDEAIEAYRQAARLDPGAFAPRGNLAELLAERGDLEGALAASQEAYRLAPDEPTVLTTLGVVYLRKGLVDRAVSFSEQAHAGAPEHPEIQLNLARAYGRAGRVDDASRLLSDLESRGDLPDPVRAGVEEVRSALQ
jgi:pentatricopeptide repeat protein